MAQVLLGPRGRECGGDEGSQAVRRCDSAPKDRQRENLAIGCKPQPDTEFVHFMFDTITGVQRQTLVGVINRVEDPEGVELDCGFRETDGLFLNDSLREIKGAGSSLSSKC